MTKVTTNIEDFLEGFRGKDIYFKPNPGNAGDALIALAAIHLFEKCGLNYRIVKDEVDLTGKIVFYGGGGNLVSFYTHCSDFISKWYAKAKELILLPHTINNHTELLSKLGQNVTIFCREHTSLSYIQEFSNIKTALLSPDLAFHLKYDDELIQTTSSNLMMKIAPYRTVMKALLKNTKPRSFFLKPIDDTNYLNAFREDVESTEHELPERNFDLSYWCNLEVEMLSKTKIEESCRRLISALFKFDIIRTNRLHIAIVGAKLNKEVHFFNNSYDKNKNVYEYSMKGFYPKVIWMGDQDFKSNLPES